VGFAAVLNMYHLVGTVLGSGAMRGRWLQFISGPIKASGPLT
jgi:hypothetical protein